MESTARAPQTRSVASADVEAGDPVRTHDLSCHQIAAMDGRRPAACPMVARWRPGRRGSAQSSRMPMPAAATTPPKPSHPPVAGNTALVMSQGATVAWTEMPSWKVDRYCVRRSGGASSYETVQPAADCHSSPPVRNTTAATVSTAASSGVPGDRATRCRAFAVAAACALVGLVLVRLLPRRYAGKRDLRRAADAATAPVRGRRWLVLLVIGGACGAAANTMLGSFLIISLVRHGVAATEAGAYYAAGAGVCVVTRTTAGWLIRRDRLRAVAAMMLVGGVSMAPLGGSSPPPVLVVAGVVAMGLGWGWQGLFAHAVADLGADRPGAATGATHAGIFVGGTVGPPVFGLLALQSFSLAWSAAAAATLLAAVAVLVGRRLAVPAPTGTGLAPPEPVGDSSWRCRRRSAVGLTPTRGFARARRPDPRA